MNFRQFGLAALASLSLVAGSPSSAQVPYAAAYTNEAWRVLNQWEDKTTTNAKLAGIAWPANSGLNWQEKYARWVQSLQKTPRTGDSGNTFIITTPYGRELPAMVADCADTTITMRVMFSSWYNLPLLIKAGKNYYGHFGVRIGGSAVTSSAICSRCDYTGYDWKAKGWPKYAPLRSKSVGSGDYQPMIPGNGRSGTYYDEIFLNKRVGWVLAAVLSGAGSGNLAYQENVYDIKAKAIAAGDVLIERWQAQGIGHAILIKHVEFVPAAQKYKIQIAAGWLPPRQVLWEGEVDAHGALSEDYFGGAGCAEQGANGACLKTYAQYGGGVKRWRPAKVVGGKWVMGIMAGDAANYIRGTDYAALGARVAEYENLVYLPQPAELRDEYLRLINETRLSLLRKASGCSARDKRESIFQELYEVMSGDFRMSRAQVDAQYRRTEDWLFAPLDYTKSPTCCWNGAKPEMGAAALKAAIAAAKAGAGACKNPVPFMKLNGDYVYRAAAGASWVNYSDDERCGRGAVASDSLMAWTVTDYCSLKLWTRE